MSRPEVHVVILWSNALPAADRILADLRGRFELLASYRVEWSRERFGENVRRFYGYDLPERVDKVAGSGSDPFLLLVVRDPAPEYGARERSWGFGPVNVTTYEGKQRWREWTGGGFRVHATVDRGEAARDVFLLLGRRLESFHDAPVRSWDEPPELSKADVVGAGGWRSEEELLTALEVTVGYVLLGRQRLLVSDRGRAEQVAGRHGELGLWAVGDGSFDEAWQRAVLRERVRDERGVYVPSSRDRFYLRLYEAVAHGRAVPPDELVELADAAGAPAGDYPDPRFARAVLDELFHRTGWRYVLPRDPAIPRNPAVLGRQARLKRELKRRAPRLARAGGRLKARLLC